LREAGNEVVGLESVIAFMANNRIRALGYLDRLNIARVRQELGAAFVLLGAVNQRQERPEPRLGLTLNLVRTSDARSVWSYAGGMSAGEERRILGLGEPESTEDLQQLLLDELVAQWPWRIINDEQLAGAVNIDSALLSPKNVRPGEEIFCRVRLQNSWAAGVAPRVFFKANDQFYPAAVDEDGVTYEGRWVAGDESGRFPVNLVLEWPLYDRRETTLLGNYLVDGTLPLFELDMLGAKILDGRPVFDRQVTIVPRMIVRKQLERWRLSFYFDEEVDKLGDMKGAGNLPKSFLWKGMKGTGDRGDGVYRVMIEVWDKAGNYAEVTEEVELVRSLPEVELAVARAGSDLVVDLGYEGKVPLSYWRLELWTQEGEILTQSEGQELPVKIDMGLPETAKNQDLEGFLFSRDIFGKEIRRKVIHKLPKPVTEAKKKTEEGVSKSWVDEF
jgi:hypothetical protein